MTPKSRWGAECRVTAGPQPYQPSSPAPCRAAGGSLHAEDRQSFSAGRSCPGSLKWRTLSCTTSVRSRRLSCRRQGHGHRYRALSSRMNSHFGKKGMALKRHRRTGRQRREPRPNRRPEIYRCTHCTLGKEFSFFVAFSRLPACTSWSQVPVDPHTGFTFRNGPSRK